MNKFVVAWKSLHSFSGTAQWGFRNFDSNLCGYDTALYWDGDGFFLEKTPKAWQIEFFKILELFVR